MDYKVFIPVLISFVLSVILGPLVIPEDQESHLIQMKSILE